MTDIPPLRFGLIGAGAISTQHLEAIDELDGARIVAIASASADRARTAAERWGAAWTTDLDALVSRDDVDAVTICSPSGLHPVQALAALHHGKHVLVEKPIALTVVDARAVAAEARNRGLVAATVSQRRFEAVPRAIHEAVTAGDLGPVSMIVAEGLYHRPQSYYDSAAWRGTLTLDGGVLMNQAIHMIDLLRWIGGPVERVDANVATLGHRMEAEDTATVSLRFASGALGAILATTCATTEQPTELRVHGERGHVRLVGEAAAQWDVPGRAAPAAAPPREQEGAPGRSATWGTNAMGYIRQYADFIAAVREARDPAVTAEDGGAAVEIIAAAYEASRTGCAVMLTGGPA
jgi:UDP-N-acetyl-2-amino-2-deoxyglucuronate dehydrogenase